jgi:transposase InsO family protein
LAAFLSPQQPNPVVVPSTPPLLGVLRRPVESAQFASWAFTQRATDSGLVPSMGSVGDCYDNSMIEAFWSRMQVELLDRHRWRTRVELANAILSTWRSSTTGNDATAAWACTLKEQCLWAELHDTIDQLRQAVRGFVHRYNHSWLIQRHGHRTPKEAYQAAQATAAA